MFELEDDAMSNPDGMPDDEDGEEAEEFELWKIRELRRLKREAEKRSVHLQLDCSPGKLGCPPCQAKCKEISWVQDTGA